MVVLRRYHRVWRCSPEHPRGPPPQEEEVNTLLLLLGRHPLRLQQTKNYNQTGDYYRHSFESKDQVNLYHFCINLYYYCKEEHMTCKTCPQESSGIGTSLIQRS